MTAIKDIISKLGLSEKDGLFLMDNDRWKKETSFPNRVKRLIEQKISPTAFFCFDNKPLILFFENPTIGKQELHEAIWNFNESPIAIIIENDSIEIFNGFNFLKEEKTLKKIGGIETLNDFSYFELVTGKTWEQYSEQLNYKNRVDYFLLQNINAARTILVKDQNLDSQIANALIGKTIFVRYLIDRKVKLCFDGESKYWTNHDFCVLLDNPQKAKCFFDYLEDSEKGFNGDLFPISKDDYSQITQDNYQVLRRLLAGEDLDSQQPSLFDFYDFSIIPIEFISNVYELFIGKDNQEKEGAYYTPLFLVDYILRETVGKKLSAGNDYYCKVLDPACGSGIFLVETLRKIIEKYIDTGVNTETEEFKEKIKDLAKHNIFGVDKDLSAVQVAIFSIYLTLLDYLNPPEIETFKFPILFGSNFFEADFFDVNAAFNQHFSTLEFDYILGNPPWMRGKGEKEKPLYIEYIDNRRIHEERKGDIPSIDIGNKEIAQAFLLRSSDFSKRATKCALIVTSKTLYNLQSSKFRGYFLHVFFIERVFELAPVRREVFDKSNDKATTPACVLFFNYANGENTASNIVEHITLKPSRFFSLFKIFTINRSDFKEIQQSKLIQHDFLWKVLVYGSYLDFNFLLRLKNDYDSIQDHINSHKDEILVKQGIKRRDGDKKIDARELLGWDFLDLKKKEINQFFIASTHQKWDLDNVGYIYRENGEICKEVFSPPALLIKETVNTKLESITAISDKKLLFTDKVTSLKFRNGTNADDYYTLASLLNSTLFAYYVLNMSSTAGIMIEQQINDEEKFNFPYLSPAKLVPVAKEIERLKKIASTNVIEDNAVSTSITNCEDELNEIIFNAFELDNIEKHLILYAQDVVIPIMMRHKGFERLFLPLKYEEDLLSRYAELFIERFKPKLDSHNIKFIVEIWHTQQIIGMFFKMIPAKEYKCPITWVKKQNDAALLTFLSKIGSEKITDRLFVQKDIRGFDNNGEDFFIIKPNERRLWSEAIGYLDVNEFADAIIKTGRGNK